MLQENLLKIYETSFRENREMSALTDYFKGETFSYYEMAKEIAKIHLLFKKAGIKQGDKIALIGRNNPRWCITYMGTITYGAVIVPILQDFTPADIIHIINHSESRLLFLGDNFWDVIEEDQIKQIEAVFSLTDFHAIYERDGKSLTKFQRDILKNYRSKYPRGFSVNDIKYPEIPNDQVVLLNYTSGTTGYSKGVMLTVNNLTSNVMFAATTINTQTGQRYFQKGGRTLSFLPLLAGKHAGVPVRILHNHSTSGGAREWLRNLAKFLLKPLAKLYATDRFACSAHAAEWMYGHVPVCDMEDTRAPKKAAIVMRNAIDTELFRFSEKKRTQTRKELKVKQGTLLFGNVGRFCPQKNQQFLIDIFAQRVRQHSNSKLVMAGVGDDMELIRARVLAAGLADKVIFAGQRSDIDCLYSAMDCFILPSNYEGLGMAGIEAQCTGLQCLFSEHVPQEVKITRNAHFLSLKTSAHDWAFAAINLAGIKRCDSSAETAASGYDIIAEAKKLAEYYLRRSQM